MKRHAVFAGAACLLLIVHGAASAEVNDLADLVPADTLNYLELHDPPRLARELHALVKGSYLQHPATFFAHHTRQRNKGNVEAFLLAWFCSPEFIDELGDWEGGCVALTGFTRSDNPIITGVLRTGRSRMVPLALRMALAASGEVHCIGRVEGVPLFQIGDAEQRKRPEIAQRMQDPAVPLLRLFHGPRAPIAYGIALLEDMPVEEPEEKPEFGCFLALMPGVIAAGSTPEILSDTIRRLKGKFPNTSLATVPAFRGAAALRNRAGLFAWTDPPRLTRTLNDFLRRDLIRRQDEIRQRPLAKGEKPNPAKRAAEIRGAEAQHRRETQEWTFFQTLVNPAAMRYATACMSLRDGEFSSVVEVRMKDRRTSPLLDVLPSERIGADLLRAVPGDAFCLFCLPLPDGPTALTRLLKLADAYAAAGDDKTPPPSKTLRELEKSLKMHLRRDVLAKIKSAGVAVHLVGQPEKEAGMYPVFVIEAVSEDAAKDLEAALPRLYGAGGKAAEPKQYTIEGQVVRSFTDNAADPDTKGPPAHYGRRGKLLVLGWHRGRVAATRRDSTCQKDLLNLPRRTHCGGRGRSDQRPGPFFLPTIAVSLHSHWLAGRRSKAGASSPPPLPARDGYADGDHAADAVRRQTLGGWHACRVSPERATKRVGDCR